MKNNLVSLTDLTPPKLQEMLDLAQALKAEWKAGGNQPLLAEKSLACVFQKPSLHTRTAFEVAMHRLGGYSLRLLPQEIKLGERESVPDAARVLSRYVDAIMARVYAHDDVLQLAEWASVPVINGLSDYNHPCQGLTDLLTIQEKLGSLSGVTLGYLGDGNNVLHSLMYGGALAGMRVMAATPEGYEPQPAVVTKAQKMAQSTGGAITVLHDPQAVAREADVLYTDTWISMGQEKEAAKRRKAFPPYQVNAELLAIAKKNMGVMHCGPIQRGQEITDEVADGPQSWISCQNQNSLHIYEAILIGVLQG